MSNKYDHRGCQSLFGYAEAVHSRSGGICQLCNAGAGLVVDFDFWRQLSVEHLLGYSQGGYLPQIRALLESRFPDLLPEARGKLAQRLDVANTVTACSFCNSTTSRYRNPESMTEMLGESSDPHVAVESAVAKLALVLKRKRAAVDRKLDSVREAFEKNIRPKLIEARSKFR
jgi:hypothetical protein